MTDPIADMLTHIRNAIRLKKPSVTLPYSQLKFTIAKILEREGWIQDAARIDGQHPQLQLTLKYEVSGDSTIRTVRRVSRPGHRVYAGKDRLPIVLSNVGIAILSTSSGVMTNREARKRGVGGEILCEIF